MKLQRKRILIVGGYGMVGSHIARLIRSADATIELILAGRNPKNGAELAKELGNSVTAVVNLDEGFDLNEFGQIDLIISAMYDRRNILRETAISKGIACITLSELADQISPTAFLSLQKSVDAPIVFAGHWQAGLVTLVVKQLAAKFDELTHVAMAGVYDQRDPVGPEVANDVSSFVGQALIRKDGQWLSVAAKDTAREVRLFDRSPAVGNPLSTLDVPSIAAFTNAPNIRFDFVVGASIGSSRDRDASHDIYIDMEGTFLSSTKGKRRTIISGPKGNSHLTAIGVYLLTEKILGINGQSAPKSGGLYLPETILSAEDIVQRLTDFGVEIIEVDC